MHTPPADTQHHQAPPDSAARRTRRRGPRRDVLAAVLAWLVMLPVSYGVVRVFDLDPLSVGGAVLPIGIGAALAVGLTLLALRRTTDVLVGTALGVFAGWMALCMLQALHGTPFPYGPIGGDEGRLLAQATKSMTTWRATDSFVKNLPTEYPPLYPWALGHLAELLGRPAWRLAGHVQVLVMSATMLGGYALWRRLVSARTAFLIVVLFASTTAQPAKDYEFVAAMVIVPWILVTFPLLPDLRGRMHWLPAGVIGGLMVCTYSAYFVFSALGIAVMIGLALRATDRRRDYLLHLLGVLVAAFVTASWYVVPFIWTSLSKGGNRVSDLYLAQDLVTHPVFLGFLSFDVRGLLALVGVVGIVWYRKQAWWAQPFLLVVASAYAYRVVLLVRTAYDNHTAYLQYTTRMLDAVLVTAGVLTLVEALPALRQRVPGPLQRQRELALLGVVSVVGWSAIAGWTQWMPAPIGARDVYALKGNAQNWATAAHAEPLPTGQLTRYFPPDTTPSIFPTYKVRSVVQGVLGAKARPVVLSFDQRLFVFLDYYGYLPPDRIAANTLQRWDDRYHGLQQLAAMTDPDQFAEAAAHTDFGPIDVFVLKEKGDAWIFSNKRGQPLVFQAASFSRHFAIAHVGHDTVVAIRQP